MSPLSFTLNDGNVVHRLAFGTSSSFHGKECSEQLFVALKHGFRHIDTAEDYFNEESVGVALKQWSGKREDVVITTKFGHSDHSAQDPRESLMRSLTTMGLSYVDLYLVHVPQWHPPGTLANIWKTMEHLKAEGLARSIGLSNFLERDIEEIASQWTIIPCVNQVEYSPFCAHDQDHRETLRACQKYEIAISAYTSLSPLTYKPYDPMTRVIKAIATKQEMTDAQVLLAWVMQTIDGPVVTSTRKAERCDEYLATHNFELSQDEIASISGVGKQVSFRQWS